MRRSRWSLDRLPSTPLGALVLLLAGVLSVLCLTGGIRAPFEPDRRDVRVQFPRAAQLHTGDQVRMNGDIAGKVEAVSTSEDGRTVSVRLGVDDDQGPIYADATAALHARTLLSGSFYVDLDRGTPTAGPLGSGTIPKQHTRQAVEIEDVTDIFRGPAVTGMQTLPGELAEGFSDARAPGAALDTLADVAPDVTRGLGALRGRAPGIDLRAVVASTDRTVRALDAPRDQLRTLVSGAAATLQTTAARRASIRALLRQAPGTTSHAERTLGRLDTTLDTADKLVDRLHDPAGDLAPTLAAVQPTVEDTASLLRRARPLVRTLRPAVTALAGAGRQGTEVLRDLTPALGRLDQDVLPGLGKPDPITERSATVMIGGFFAGFGGSGGQQDTNGHFIRFPATAGASSVALPCTSALVDPSATALVACKDLGSALSDLLSYAPPLK